MEYAKRAVEAGGDNFACHKWMGVLISYSSEFEGYKRKIERSFDIRDSFEVIFCGSVLQRQDCIQYIISKYNRH